MSQTFTKLIPGEDIAFSQVSIETHSRFFNIFNAENLNKEFFAESPRAGSGFGILRLLAKANSFSVAEVSNLMTSDELVRTLTLMHAHKQRHTRQVGKLWSALKDDEVTELNYRTMTMIGESSQLDVQIMDFMKYDEAFTMYRETKIISVIDNSIDIVPPVVLADPADWKYYSGELASIQLKADLCKLFVPPVIAESI
mmetsp:Transcript_9867/g.13456  ORF Transcript_9867/g.13456 Transcript_9867/m.13456 type:complete len:198 (-) Transcript_9867:1194-1787(-)